MSLATPAQAKQRQFVCRVMSWNLKNYEWTNAKQTESLALYCHQFSVDLVFVHEVITRSDSSTLKINAHALIEALNRCGSDQWSMRFTTNTKCTTHTIKRTHSTDGLSKDRIQTVCFWDNTKIESFDKRHFSAECPLIRVENGIVKMRAAFGGWSFLCIGVHLKALTGKDHGDETRKAEVASIVRLCNAYKTTSVVVIGDLNTDPLGVSCALNPFQRYDVCNASLGELTSAGFIRISDDAGRQTWHGATETRRKWAKERRKPSKSTRKLVRTSYKKQQHSRLDHAFVKGFSQVKNVVGQPWATLVVIEEKGAKGAKDRDGLAITPREISDHSALILDVHRITLGPLNLAPLHIRPRAKGTRLDGSTCSESSA